MSMIKNIHTLLLLWITRSVRVETIERTEPEIKKDPNQRWRQKKHRI